MKAIYNTGGKAKEYELKACNLYDGCGHGCTYCYAAMMAVRFGKVKSIEDFFKNPRPREGIIEALRKDAKKLRELWYKKIDIFQGHPSRSAGDRPFIFLCFTCDPYQPINKEHNLTRQAIEILHEYGLGVNILTKGSIPAKDFELLAKNPHLSKVGVTLTGAFKTLTDEKNNYEPNTTDNTDRIIQLSKAKLHGIKTWVSMEPVINPENCLGIIELYNQYVDEWKIGKWNYSKEADKIDWRKFTNEAIKLLDDLKCKYYIKEDLRKYIKEPTDDR